MNRDEGKVNKQKRFEVANEFIKIIAEHGRKFFRHRDRVGCFELDGRGRIWFIDEYTAARIYLHYRYWGKYNFTGGGTLRELINALKDYILGKRGLPLGFLGPWSKELCNGDLWGYGFEEMEKVRNRCTALLATIDSSNEER